MGNRNEPSNSPDRAMSPEVSLRSLLVINDRLIREKYFAETNDILQKIEDLELKIRAFHSSDQRLYDQWHQSTFREDQRVIDQTQSELKDLARFHNWVVATSHQMDLELQDAYALMKDEAWRYQNGTPEQRHRIDMERKERDAFVEAEVDQKYSEPSWNQNDEDSEYSFQNPLEQILKRLEDMILPEDREPLSDVQARMDRINDLTDDELEYFMRDQEVIFLLFDVSLSWAESEQDYSFFLRIWKLMSRSQKATFSEVYGVLTGQSIEDLVTRVGGKRGTSESFDEETFEDETNQNGFSFDENSFERRSNRAERRQKLKPLEEEKIKSLYRNLIRRLHPDAHSGADNPSSQLSPWIKRAWEKVQKAYHSKDIESLDRLLKLTLLRTHALDQLTLDEIREARGWLKKDLNSVEKESLQLKRFPAWGFSGKKNHNSLLQRIRKQFQRNLDSLHSQIEEIKEQHRFLEMLLTMELESRERDSNGLRRKSTKKHRNRRSSRTETSEDNQDSFSFD